MITLRLLGGLTLEGPDGAFTGPSAQRKRLALLALLALAPDQRLGREKLLAYLWPESDAERARHQLSSALYEVRKAAGEDAVLSAGDELWLNTGLIHADVAEFESALEEGDPERAVALHRGPLLDGFFLSDAPEFERWVDRERERFAGFFARALESAAEAAQEQGDLPGAAEWWKARAAHDPYDSRVALRLMEALVASGNRAGALQHAASHERWLREEFGLDPDPEVQALADRMRSAPSEPVRPPRVIGDVDEVEGSIGAVAAETRHGRRWPVRQSATALSLVALGGLAVVLAAFWVSQQGSGSSHLQAQRVVVVPLENRTGDPALDPVGSMATDRIAQALARTGAADVVRAPGAGLGPSWDAAAVGHARDLDAVTTAGEGTGTALLVSGAYYRRGDSLQFHAQITDAGEPTVLRALEPVTGATEDPGAAVEMLSRRAAGALAVVLDTRLATIGNLASQPSNYEAYHACLEGLDRFFASDWTAATLHFERSMQLDSTYLFPLLHIGYVGLNVGDLAHADSIVRVLNRSRERMMPFELAVLDLLSAFLADDPVASYEAARRAAAIGPGSPPHVQWGGEALRLNRPGEAIQILSAIDPEAAPVGGWPLYWVSLTRAYHELGQHRRELREARRARALYPDEPWSLLLEARAIAARGRLKELEALLDARRSLPDQRQPRLGSMKEVLAHELRVHGRPDAAAAMLDRAIAWYAARPADEQAQTRHRRQLGFSLLGAERLDGAEALLRGLALEDPEDVVLHGAVGVLAAVRDDAAEAERIAGWLAIRKRPYHSGDRLLWRGCIAAHRGDLSEALSLLQEAAGRGARFEHTHFCLKPLREYPPFRAFMRPKG